MKNRVVAALDAVCQDYSPDRVVADPDMNEAFLAECARAGLNEPAAFLNHFLLNLRKRGLLRGRKSKKTLFPNQSDYAFASEMAVRFLERRDSVSLDEIISNPDRAREFDGIASQIAPGYSPLRYRWAALSLRKTSRLRPELLSRVVKAVRVIRWRVETVDLVDLPCDQGLYLFHAKSVALYAGEAESLRNRLAKHIEHSDNKGLARWLWEHGKEELHLEIQILPKDTPTRIRRALELELIRSRSPIFNVQR
jgi:hypothetical protein